MVAGDAGILTGLSADVRRLHAIVLFGLARLYAGKQGMSASTVVTLTWCYLEYTFPHKYGARALFTHRAHIHTQQRH